MSWGLEVRSWKSEVGRPDYAALMTNAGNERYLLNTGIENDVDELQYLFNQASFYLLKTCFLRIMSIFTRV